MRIDWDKVREDRLAEIDEQIKKCVFNRNWSKKAILEKEKVDLVAKINKK